MSRPDVPGLSRIVYYHTKHAVLVKPETAEKESLACFDTEPPFAVDSKPDE